jgi:hypothetical protein
MNYQIEILPQALSEIEESFRWQSSFVFLRITVVKRKEPR